MANSPAFEGEAPIDRGGSCGWGHFTGAETGEDGGGQIGFTEGTPAL